MGFTRCAVAVLPVCLAAAAEAQQPPVFRVGVELLEVDVSVVDGEGEPIADLSGSEFAVSIDGKPRLVVSAQFVDLRPAATASRTATAAAPAVSYSANTTGGRGRVIVLAIDRDSIAFSEGREVMAAAGAFLDTLGPNDQVALVHRPPAGSGGRLHHGPSAREGAPGAGGRRRDQPRADHPGRHPERGRGDGDQLQPGIGRRGGAGHDTGLRDRGGTAIPA